MYLVTNINGALMSDIVDTVDHLHTRRGVVLTGEERFTVHISGVWNRGFIYSTNPISGVWNGGGSYSLEWFIVKVRGLFCKDYTTHSED